MSKYVKFSKKAFDDYNYFALTDKKTYKKLIKLITEISRTPYEGSGQPEKLRYNFQDFLSRRINKKDRILYQVNDDEILIVSCKGHYLDK